MAHQKSQHRSSPKQQRQQKAERQQQSQEQRIQFLEEQIELGISPYQAFVNTSEQKGFDGTDAQLFRISLIKKIEQHTNRPLIVYESHLSKGSQFGINMLSDDDKIGFCSLTDNITADKIDILIHSPGGRAESVEEIVHILRNQFDHIRFIIPDAAKSAATMLALSGDSLLMDERSELGPIDPQVPIITAAADNCAVRR